MPLSKESLNIVRRSKAELTKVLLSKYNCDVSVSNGDLEDERVASLQSWSGVVDEKRFEMTLRSGVKVSVWKADLTSFPVHAVVNAANENLRHVGGLAYALAQAGGPLIQQDSSEHVRARGPVATGCAVMMDAHRLPCRKIIHAVGPRLSRYFSPKDLDTAERLLSQAVCSVLDLVENEGLHTVAIPAISSGIFNFPLAKCAETIVRALSCARFLKEIHLVNNDEPTVRAMELACKEQLEKYQHTRAASSGIKANGKKRTSSATFRNVRVTLKRGLIEDEQVRTSTFTSSRSLPWFVLLPGLTLSLLLGHRLTLLSTRRPEHTGLLVSSPKPYCGRPDVECRRN